MEAVPWYLLMCGALIGVIMVVWAIEFVINGLKGKGKP